MATKKKSKKPGGKGAAGAHPRSGRLPEERSAQSPPPRSRPETLGRERFIAVVLAALVMRVMYLVVASREGLFGVLLLDSEVYVNTAIRIAQGLGAGDHPYLLSPLYPYLLAPLVDSAGVFSILGAQILQALFGSLTAGLAALMAARVAGRTTGLIAGLATALYGPLIFLDGAILVAGLQTFFLTLALAFLVFEEPGRPGDRSTPVAPPHGYLARHRAALCWLASGLAFGVSAALRPTGFALALFVLGGLWVGAFTFRRGQHRTRDLLLRSGAMLLGLALVILPFTTRNIVRGGEAVLLSANGGFNFWVGNNAASNGLFRNPEGYDVVVDPVARKLAERGAGQSLTYRDSSAWWSQRAFADIRSAPARWLGLLVRKTIHFGNPSEIAQMFQEFEWYKELVWVLRFPLDARVILLLALLSPLGLWLEGRAREWPRLQWPLIFLVGYTGVVVLFFVTSRYRVPIIPASMVLASVTVLSVWNLARAWFKNRSKGIAPMLVCVVVLAAGSYALYDAPTAPFRIEVRESTKAWDKAHVLAEQGEIDAAASHFERSLEEQETWQVHYDYAAALWGSKRFEEAREHLLATVRLNPEWEQAWFFLGELRRGKDGDMERARVAYDRALSLNPDYYEAHFGLAALCLDTGEFGPAAEHLRRFLDLAPQGLPLRATAEEMLREAESRLQDVD